MAMTAAELIKADQDHLIHPLHHPIDHAEPMIYVRGRGATTTFVQKKIGDVHLDVTDIAAIHSVTHHRRGPRGDVYELERDRNGPHGRIMNYTLNR